MTSPRPNRLGAALASLAAVLAATVVLSTAALLLTPLGAYLNRTLFFEPVMVLRSQLQLRPKLADSIRVIVLDDQSLKRIGRHPTYAEWEQIAGLLFTQGFDKALLVDLFSLPSEVGDLGVKPTNGTLVLGAVASVEGRNTLTVDLTRLQPGRLLAGGADALGSGLMRARHAYVPFVPIRARGNALGSLTNLEDETMPVGFVAPDGRILPSLGLLAADGVRWEGGRLVTDRGRVPMSEDGTQYIDFVDPESSLRASLPVGAFFRPEQGRMVVRDALSKRVAGRLQGGKLAILVPAGHTGSRFIDSPDGKVLSYEAVVSMANSALLGRYLYRPVPFAWLTLLFAPFVFLMLRLKSRRALALAGATAVAVPLVSIGLFCTLGWVLPCLQMATVLVAGTAVRVGHEVLRSAAEKALLKRDLEVGTLVQQLLLPSAATGRVGGWEYQVVFKPYGYMAGDWFQVFSTTTDRTGPVAVVAIGDVVGKGPSAALMTALIAGIWNDWKKTWTSGKVDVEAFVQALHRSIADTFKGAQNTTLSLAVLTESEATLVSISAPSWVHVSHEASQVTMLRHTRSNPIGHVDAQDGPHDFHVPQLRLEPAAGDALMAYTDGVMNSGRVEARFLRQVDAGLPAWKTRGDDLLRALEETTRKVVAEGTPADDFTILFIRRLEPLAAVSVVDFRLGA